VWTGGRETGIARMRRSASLSRGASDRELIQIIHNLCRLAERWLAFRGSLPGNSCLPGIAHSSSRNSLRRRCTCCPARE